MIKNWRKYIKENNSDHQEWLDELSKEKDSYMVLVLLNGSEEDLRLISNNLEELYGVLWDSMSPNPPICYYGLDWIKDKRNTEVSNDIKTSLSFKNAIQSVASDMGYKVKTFVMDLSEYDIETGNTLPPSFKNSLNKLYKGMNE